MSWSWPAWVEYEDPAGVTVQVGDFQSEDEAAEWVAQEVGPDAIEDESARVIPVIEPPTGPWGWQL